MKSFSNIPTAEANQEWQLTRLSKAVLGAFFGPSPIDRCIRKFRTMIYPTLPSTSDYRHVHSSTVRREMVIHSDRSSGKLCTCRLISSFNYNQGAIPLSGSSVPETNLISVCEGFTYLTKSTLCVSTCLLALFFSLSSSSWYCSIFL
jgi:hypothetical protein